MPPPPQLSFNFPEIQIRSCGNDSAVEFARVQRAKTLLRELAVALGEQRATADFETYRMRMTMPGEGER